MRRSRTTRRRWLRRTRRVPSTARTSRWTFMWYAPCSVLAFPAVSVRRPPHRLALTGVTIPPPVYVMPNPVWFVQHDKHKTGATTSTSGLGFFANLMSFFRNPFGSLFSFFRGFISSPFKSLAGLFGLSAGLSSMGLLTLLALTLVPLYLFWMRRRVAAPAARPQVCLLSNLGLANFRSCLTYFVFFCLNIVDCSCGAPCGLHCDERCSGAGDDCLWAGYLRRPAEPRPGAAAYVRSFATVLSISLSHADVFLLPLVVSVCLCVVQSERKPFSR